MRLSSSLKGVFFGISQSTVSELAVKMTLG